MKISVITVAWNAAATIAATIESFLAQSYPDKELLVVDGASTDGTLDILSRYSGESAITVHSAPDRGMYDAANKGLLLYSGEAVGFLNADDRFHDGAVLGDIARGLKRADIVFAGVDFVDSTSTGITRRWRATPFKKGAFRRGWMPAHPSFYVRRRVANAVGSFDLNYRIAADYDWMLRACELHDFRTCMLDRTVVDMRQGGASTGSLYAYITHNLEALAARRRWLNSGLADIALFAKPLRKISQFVT